MQHHGQRLRHATHPAKKPAPPALSSAQNSRLPPLVIEEMGWWESYSCHVSSELADACDYRVKGSLATSEAAVQAWLRQHAALMISAEMKWKVDRRAIAGVIAWEALRNIKNMANWVRKQTLWNGIGYGPGKIHFDASAVDVEQAGYLPQVSDSTRQTLIASVVGGVTYIAAIMRGSADLFTCLGKYPTSMTYWNPYLLAFCYHGWRFDKIREKYGQEPGKLNFGNHKTFDVTHEKYPMVLWIINNIPFLEKAVGVPSTASKNAHIDKLPNFKCEYSHATKSCAQEGCPHHIGKPHHVDEPHHPGK